MRYKHCLLVYPPTGLYDRWDRCQAPIESETVEIIRPPMDLAYIASVLEGQGIQCTIRDYPAEGKTWDSLHEDLKGFNPDVLVVSAVLPTFERDCKAFDVAKEFNRGILTIVKGAVALGDGADKLRQHGNLDVIVRDEAALTVGDIFRNTDLAMTKGITYRMGDKIRVNPQRPPLEDLDLLPFPARHLCNNDLYRMPDSGRRMGIVLTGIGCPFQCIYCLVGNTFGRKLKLRSPSSIVAEIEECITKHDIRDFWFRADTFTCEKYWVIEVCQKILDRGLKINWTTNSRVDTLDEEMLDWMKRSGCFALGLGIESGNQEMLDKMKKGTTLDQARDAVKLCKKKGILTYLFFIIGLPWESEKTIKDSIRFAKELQGDFTNFTVSYPFPGTALYDIAVGYKLLRPDESMDGFDYSNPVADTLYMSKEEVVKWPRIANRSVLLQPSYVIRTLRRINSPAMIYNYIRAGLKVLTK